MGYLMIVAGVLLVAAGIFTLSCNGGKNIKGEERSIKTEEALPSSNDSNDEVAVIEKTPLEKGKEFEDYIVRLLQNNSHMKIINRSADRIVDGKIDEDSKNPDIVAELQLDNGNKYRFAVECKWRGKSKQVIEWANNEGQLDRYKKYAKDNGVEVFVALGLGGEPDGPDELFIIPLNKLNSSKCKYSELKPYFKKSGNFLFYDIHTHNLRLSN